MWWDGPGGSASVAHGSQARLESFHLGLSGWEELMLPRDYASLTH